MLYKILLLIHVFFFISWLVSLLYLPRLFVYHASTQVDSHSYLMLLTMEKKLIRIIMYPAFIFVWLSGISLAFQQNLLSFHWLYLKILLVLLLSIYQFFLIHVHHTFATKKNLRTSKFFRITNEIPSVLLLIIIWLVIFKPF